MPTVVVVSRVNQLDPSIRVDVYTYGEHVVEVQHIGVHGCIIYDVTRDLWLTDIHTSGGGTLIIQEYLSPLAAQLKAFEALGVSDAG